jgi:pilus assembly protein FimV
MNNHFEPLESGEVVSVEHDAQVLSGHRTFRVGELNDAIKNQLENAIAGWNDEQNNLFSPSGIDCEALRFGSSGWQKGRIRLCLEFCPDEEIAAIHSADTSKVPAINVTPADAPKPLTHTDSHQPPVDAHSNATEIESASDTPSTIPVVVNDTTLPMVGVAVATVAAAAVIPATDRAVTETVLELEEDHSSTSSSDGDISGEIAFDFDRGGDNQGKIVPNGRMELDLTDLGIDLPEHDFLNFETNGMPDSPQELMDLHEFGNPENSGMLIDEVWNEMSQPNWPGIH